MTNTNTGTPSSHPRKYLPILISLAVLRIIDLLFQYVAVLSNCATICKFFKNILLMRINEDLKPNLITPREPHHHTQITLQYDSTLVCAAAHKGCG